jgi:glycosyltransferase involved in cell wall biosynthesis
VGRNVDIGEWREQSRLLLAGARKVFVPHSEVGKRLARYFPHLRFTERPHFEFSPRARPVAARLGAGEKLRVAVIGAIDPRKGVEIVDACARNAWERNLPLQFHVIGYTSPSLVHVTVTGRYQEDEVYDVLEGQQCHCAFFSSIWPETFSYVLSIVFRAQLFPVAFDLGAPAARIRETGWGHLIPLTHDPVLINDQLLDVSRQLLKGIPAPLVGITRYENLWRDYYELPPVERAMGEGHGAKEAGSSSCLSLPVCRLAS